MLVLGTVINIITNWPGISAQVILGGMISGLASTGLYEMMRNLLDKDGQLGGTEGREGDSGDTDASEGK